MSTQIKCPHCNQQFEPTEAFKHELEETLLKEAQDKHQAEIELLKKEKLEIEAKQAKQLEEAEKKLTQKIKQEAQASIAKDLKDKQDQITKLTERAEKAEEEELEMRKQKRELEESKRKFEVEKQRQLDQEREKIRLAAVKEAEDKNALLMAQEKKKNDDAQKQILELQRKLQQGSQQAQGEVMELELEALLKSEFPLDKITEVKKGVRGADVVQEVIDKRGQNCGTILWESKNAKWSQTWIATLKENQRQAKAQLAVLVATNTPDDIETFTYREGIWIANRKMAVPLALALRYDLVRVAFEKKINMNKSEKAEVLYQYITSTDFRHRVEAIVETFTEMQTTIETEKRWFTSKWAKQEKQIRRVVDNTIGMRADLEGLVGNVLPAVNFLELPDENDES